MQVSITKYIDVELKIHFKRILSFENAYEPEFYLLCSDPEKESETRKIKLTKEDVQNITQYSVCVGKTAANFEDIIFNINPENDGDDVGQVYYDLDEIATIVEKAWE